MRTIRLAGGEHAAATAVEVLRIPDESVVADLMPGEAAHVALRYEFTRLLEEVAGIRPAGTEVSLEILWRAVAVPDQVHAADIRTFVVVRALGPGVSVVAETVDDVTVLVQGLLSATGYDSVHLEDARLDEALPARTDSVLGIQRRIRPLNLHNPAVPTAYVFDRLPEETAPVSRLFDILVASPGASLSVQVSTADHTDGERAYLNATAVSLGALERGVADPSLGGIAFSTAREPAETYRYYAERSSRPVLRLVTVVAGAPGQTRMLASMAVGALSAVGANATVDLVALPIQAGTLAAEQDMVALPWRTAGVLDAAGPGQIWPTEAPPVVRRLGNLVTPWEATQLLRLPHGTRRIGAGFQVNQTLRRSRSFLHGVVDHDVDVGTIGSQSSGVSLGFKLDDLTKHLFVAGTPGSGKTTFNVGLLDRLWREHGIPFLVIEPAKNEYRAMIESIPDLRVFTPGKSWLSPLVLNPFLPPAGVRLENHKTVLKTAFAAAVTMTSPLDRIFSSALDRLYADFGWLDRDDVGAGHAVPSIRDFIAAFRDTFDAIGYTGDAQNIGRAGLVRLEGMLRLFDTNASVPITDLCEDPCVVELAAVENAADKALYIALILLQLLSHHNANTEGTGGLRQVVLLEEAHVLFETSDANQEGAASPATIAQGLLKRMLAEIRSFGVGVIVADQSPRKVTADVLALTNIKVAFRIVEGDDRRLLANSANMTPEQESRLAGLRPGEAFLFHDRLAVPEEVRTPDYRAVTGLATTLSDAELDGRLTYYRQRPELLRPFPECALLPAWDPDLDDVALHLARRVFDREVGVGQRDAGTAKAAFQGLPATASGIDERYPAIGEPLLGMVRLHFLRLLRYETAIRMSDDFAATLLRTAYRRGNP